MLAAQVNARKHENLRMILGFEWIGGLFFCEGLLCWVVVAAAAAGRGLGLIWTAYPSPPFACWPELWVPIASCSDRWSDGCSPRCNRVWCLCWTSVHAERVYRGRCCDVSLRLRSMFAHRCIVCMLCRGLLYVVCWYVGVLPLKVGSCGRSRPQDVDFALRRSCLVVKITMYIHFCAYMCTFFLVCRFS